MKEKILITGGLGFIGGRLCKHLIENNYIVYAASRKTRPPVDLDSRVNFVHMNWENQSDFEDLFKDIDFVIHAAGLDSKSCMENPEKALQVNGKGTSVVLQAAINEKVKKFIFFSTVHVFSRPLVGQFSRSSATINSHPYATSNIEGENYVLKASKEKMIEGIVLRLSNVFGAPAWKNTTCWDLFVNNVCKELIMSQKMTLNSSGYNKRNFFPMNALCELILKIITNQLGISNVEPLVISSKESLTLIDMIKKIQERFKKITSLDSKTFKKSEKEEASNAELVLKSDFIIDENFLNLELDNLINYCLNNFTNSASRSHE